MSEPQRRLEQLLEEYETQAEELRAYSKEFRQNGLLAKHRQAEEMLAPIESLIAKMEGMGYAGRRVAAPSESTATAAEPQHESTHQARDMHEDALSSRGRQEGAQGNGAVSETNADDSFADGLWKLAIPAASVSSAKEVDVELLETSHIEVTIEKQFKQLYAIPHGLDTDTLKVRFSRRAHALAVTMMQMTLAQLGVYCAKQLQSGMFACVDYFLPKPTAEHLLNWVKDQRSLGVLKAGEVEGGLQRHTRGDEMAWVSAKNAGGPLLEYASRLDDLILEMTKHCAELASSNLIRDKAMVTCYPGNGSRYVRHMDNANNANRTRVLTTIIYLNPSWEEQDGGQLRVFTKQGGHQDVSPLHNRLAMFWSDHRAPHEVLPTMKDRFAVSFWYHNGSKMNEIHDEGNRK